MTELPRIRLVQPSDVRTPDDVREGVRYDGGGSNTYSGLGVTNDKPSDEQVLNALIANNCIPVRVSACLNVTEEYVLSVAIRHPRILSTMMRTRLMMSSFTTLIKMDAAVQANLSEMVPDTLGRAYAATLTAFTNLAGQFEEQQVNDDTDDASAAKTQILERLEKMGKREAAAQVLMQQQNAGGSAG